MSFPEEKDSNLIKLLVEETYRHNTTEDGEEGSFHNYFNQVEVVGHIDDFLSTVRAHSYIGENFENFVRVKINNRLIDVPKNLNSFDEITDDSLSVSRSNDNNFLIHVLTGLDPQIKNTNQMIIYFQGNQSRTIFFESELEFEKAVSYLKTISSQADRIGIAA